MKRLLFATEMFLRIMFKRNYLATNMNYISYYNMNVDQANNIINTIQNKIDLTVNPINLMNEVNDILSKPPKF